MPASFVSWPALLFRDGKYIHRARKNSLGFEWFEIEFCSCLGYRAASIGIGSIFVISPEIRNPSNHVFRIVTTGESPLRIRPIGFGLAAVSGLHSACVSGVIFRAPRRVGRILVRCKIAKVIDLGCFLNRAHQKLFVVLSVCESRHAQHTGYVRRRRVASKRRCQ